MPIFAKVGTSSWSTNAKKVWVKASDGWKSGTKLFAKTISGWVQMWPGDAPASSLTDPIDIRLTGYNGPRATSPQFINTVLYGNDGTITGATPITVTNRRMYISEDNTGNTTRYQLTTTDVYNMNATLQQDSDIGFKRYMADGWWLFYQLTATNSSGSSVLYSPPIKIIRQTPTFSTNSPSLNEDYSSTDPYLSVNFSFSDTWWRAADLSRSYVRWWQNSSKSPGGTPLRTTYIQDIFGLATLRSGSYSDYNGTGTTVSGVDSYTVFGGIPAGQYIIAEVVLINSFTDHNNSPVSAFVSTGNKPSIIALTLTDDNGNGVVDNQSTPRIISDGYLNFTATVQDAASSTYYLLEPRMYNWVNGSNYEFNSSTVIGPTSFPTDLTPSSVTLNGTTATVRWRIYIDANTIYNIGFPTYSGGQSRWQFEFRVSARASASSTNSSASYFTGTASLGGESVYLQGLDVPGMINVHPSSAMTLNASATNVGANTQITFSGTTVGYPVSTYSSFPRRYMIDFGDGTNSGWNYFSTGTSNPSFSGITKSYSSTGTYVATLRWEPQGDPSRSTRSRTIIVSPPLTAPTSTSIVSMSRISDNTVRAVISSSGGSGPYYQLWWTSTSTAPSGEDRYDAASTTSTVTEESGFASGFTYYFYVRSSSENLGNTTINGTGTSGTYSDYGPFSGAASYTFQQPSGSVSVFPSSGTAGTTTFTASPSVSAAPSADISYQWQYLEGGVLGFVGISGATSSTYTPPSNYVSIYGSSLRCQITANNGVGNSLVTASGTITVNAALTKLSTPTGVSASDTRSDGVLISWNAVSGAAYYGVWYGGVPSYDFLADFGGNRNTSLITGTSYLDTAIGTGVTRDYYVQAYRSGDPTGTKSDWSAGDFGTRVSAATVPGAPTGLFASNISSSGATINWSPPSSNGGATITNYEVNRDGFGFFNVGNVTQYFYTLSQGTYTIGVRAVNSVGAGPASTVSVTIPAAVTIPATPTGLSLSGSGFVSWNASSGATSYELLNYTDRTGSPTNTTNRLGPFTTTGITGTSFQLTNNQGYASPNNWARVQVRARNSAGVSSYSAWVPSATTYT